MDQSWLRNPHRAVLTGGILLRVVFWIIYPPIWKAYAIFTPLQGSVLAYAADFQSYHPLRMPFYDIVSAAVFVPFQGLVGTKATTLFSLFIGCGGLIAFNIGTRKLFDNRVALASTVLFAFYPKLLTMTARGFPEAAGVAAIGCMLAALAYGFKNSDLRAYAVAGVFALSAYLLYMPAVFVGIVTVGYLIARDLQSSRRPSRGTVAFSLPPLIIGVTYLVYGPVRTAVAAATGESIGFASRQLFVGSYGPVERVVRYVGYTVVDFWWHQRGFDSEHLLLDRMEVVAGFLGPGFLPAVFGWAVAAALLTCVVVVGGVAIARQRTTEAYWLLAWVLLFAVLYNGRNVGWTGAFMTRHVAPVIPALCVLFGFGTVRLAEAVGGVYRLRLDVDTETVVTAGVAFMLVGLAIVGGVNGIFTARDAAVTESEIDNVAGVVGDDSVAVVDQYTYYRVILYSHGSIQPTILLPPEARGSQLYLTAAAEVRYVSEPSLAVSDATYGYVLRKCRPFDRRQAAFVEREQVVFNHQVAGPGCDTWSALVTA